MFIDLAHRSTYLRMVGGKSCMSGYSYSTCRQCRNATVTVANNSGLPGHAHNRNCLGYSLLSVSRSLPTLAVVSIYYFCFLEQTVSYMCSLVYSLVSRLSPRANKKPFLYCKRQNAERGLEMRPAWYIVLACNVD